MILDIAICDRARRARDPRFDGLFFIGVKSTGIYCRPICPAPPPRPENIVYYPTAAAAAADGLRPCMRCRPETAPGTPAWNGTSATVSRAMNLIRQEAPHRITVTRLTQRLGVGERHLRRLFRQHLGTTPKAMLDNHRLLFAKKLIVETDMPITQVAMAAGYGSLSRFNVAFRRHVGQTPSHLRKAYTPDGRRNPSEFRCSLNLTYRPPYDWPRMLTFFRDRAIPGVEWADNHRYFRTIRLSDCRGTLAVRHARKGHQLVLDICLDESRVVMDAVERVRRMFDLDANPLAIHRTLKQDPLLGQHIRRMPGLRLPGAWDPFEAAVRAIVGQQISVKGAVTQLGRLTRLANAGQNVYANSLLALFFPNAAELARTDLASFGMPGKRKQTLLRLAQMVQLGEVTLSVDKDLTGFIDKLTAIPGIGDWTAHYVAMRALSEPDAFPASDLGIIKALQTGERRPTVRQVLARAEAWRPWRSYGAIYLWTGKEDK